MRGRQEQIVLHTVSTDLPIYIRKTHLLSMDNDMTVRANGFNYWFYAQMLGPYHNWMRNVAAGFSHRTVVFDLSRPISWSCVHIAVI